MKVIVIRHSDNNQVKHFNNKLLSYALSQIKNSNGTNHSWNTAEVRGVINRLGYTIPSTSTIEDITYTANMAYADFFPSILTEDQCIMYAMNVANDIDGYEGIQLYRWLADQDGKGVKINLNEFI